MQSFGLILTILVLNINCIIANVEVSSGVITISGYDKCHININNNKLDLVLNKTIYVHDSVALGLIKWKCDNEYGSVISKITCQPCGIYCSYNQQFVQCANNTLPYVVGALSSVLIIMTIIIILRTCCKRQFKNMMDNVIVWYLTRDDRKRVKKIKILNSLTGTKNSLMFRYLFVADRDVNQKIMDKRLNLRKELSGDEPIYQEICHAGSEANKYSLDLEDRVVNNPHHQRGANAGKYLLAGALSAMVLTHGAEACDKTLYLSGNGKVCDSMSCGMINTYQTSVQTGSTICFNTVSGDKIAIQIKKANTVTRYEAMYYACSHQIKVDSTYECKSPGGNCWNGGTCKIGNIHPLLKTETIYPSGYGCHSGSLGCDEWCWHQTACTWYRWIVQPNLDECYKVYRKVSEIWQISIIVKYKNYTTHVKLNSNNPKHNLDGSDIEGLEQLPLYITNLIYEQVHVNTDIIIYNSVAYSIDASQQNFPIPNTIGEYQLSLDKQTATASLSDIDCRTEACKTTCSNASPSINKLVSTKSAKVPHDQIQTNGEYIIKRIIPIQATATIVFGSVKIDSLSVTPSFCRINLETNYACTGCTDKPIAVFKAYDIKSEGILEIESNCTWTTPYLSCNPEPFIMTLEMYDSICYIYIPSNNQTIYVNFNYEFVGSLTHLNPYYTESTGEVIGTLAKDPKLWTSLIGSLSSMLLFTLGGSVLIRIAKVGVAYKLDKDINKV